MNVIALRAFSDNYLWLLHTDASALVVDPGDAAPVLAELAARGLRLEQILVTHHHGDHIGGVAALRAATGALVAGPATEAIPQPFRPVHQGDQVPALGLSWRVLDVPGHTAGHVAYLARPADHAPLLFCGDTLFSGGCGRLFEGTPAQMLTSLDALAGLPDDTQVYAAHEYTLANLRFARAVEPDNAELVAYQQHCMDLQAAGQPTLPSTLRQERAINPFLRTRLPAVRQAVRARQPGAHDDVAVFAALREWKNEFR